MANHNFYIGIDLGTTNSVMAWGQVDSNKGPIKPEVVAIRMLDTNGTTKKDSLLPSCVYFDEKEKNRTITGEYAKYLTGPKAERVVKSVKIKMGTSDRYKIDSNYYTAPEISTRILMQLKGSAEQTLFRNIPFPNDVAIAVPASFEKKMRRATKKAAQHAGFKNITLVDEPVAVLHDFNNRLHTVDIPDRRYDFRKTKRVLVFDLGGGTLDVSLQDISYGQNSYDLKIKEIAVSRFTKIGGNNFDRNLADFLLKDYLDSLPAELNISKKDKRDLEINFLLYAEKAKIDLSNKSKRWKLFQTDELDPSAISTDILEVPYENLPFRYSLSLNTYEECVETFLANHLTLEFVDQFDSKLEPEDIIDPILDVLKKAQDKLNLCIPPEPDVVLLNGSMSKLHTVQKRLEAFFGFPPDDVGDPDLAVARGAVVYAANEARRKKETDS